MSVGETCHCSVTGRMPVGVAHEQAVFCWTLYGQRPDCAAVKALCLLGSELAAGCILCPLPRPQPRASGAEHMTWAKEAR